MNNIFIKTGDAETAKLLLSLNYNLISESNGVWTFKNDPSKMVFSEYDKSKVAFSNILCV